MPGAAGWQWAQGGFEGVHHSNAQNDVPCSCEVRTWVAVDEACEQASYLQRSNLPTLRISVCFFQSLDSVYVPISYLNCMLLRTSLYPMLNFAFGDVFLEK